VCDVSRCSRRHHRQASSPHAGICAKPRTSRDHRVDTIATVNHKAINASSLAFGTYKLCLASSFGVKSHLLQLQLPSEAQTFTAEPRAAILHQNELESSPRILSYRQSSSIDII
jgi:hypothetical protein